MAECGGVGGSKGGGANSVGGDGSVGAADKSANGSGGKNSAGKTDSQNSEAKTNNVDGAKSKTGIDREPQQKADLNAKTDAAKTEQAKTEAAKTEQAKTEQAKTEAAKTEEAKTEQTKTEQAKTQSKTEQTLADKVKEKAKEMLAKAAEFAKTVKTELGKTANKTKKELAQEAKRKANEKLLHEPKVQAMLHALGFSEGTFNNYGKVVNGTVIGPNKKNMPSDTTLKKGMKNVTTTDFSKHPNVAVRWAKGQKPSSAAGRYQFLSKTWQDVAQKLGLKDFSPYSQDLAAVELMKERGMIGPLLKGDLRTAVTRGSREWASLPKANGKGNYKGQRARSFEKLERAFNDYLNTGE